MNQTKKCQRGTGMYLACGGICTGGVILFAMLMAVAYEAIHTLEELSAHEAGIFVYCGGSVAPCVAALVLLVLVIHEIAQGRAFSEKNARRMRGIACMAFLECAYLMVGCIGYMCVGLMHPGIMLIVLALVLLGGGIGLLAWALARLVKQASALQQENDLTI